MLEQLCREGDCPTLLLGIAWRSLKELNKQVPCCCSVAQRPARCHPMDRSTPGFADLHHLPEFAQTHVHWVDDSVQPSHPLSSPSPPAFNQSSGPFPLSQFFKSGGQSIGVSASTSVLLMNIQGWFPLGLIGLISLQSKGLSRFFPNTTVHKHKNHGTLQSHAWV